MSNLFFLVPFFPLLGFIIIGLFWKKLPKNITSIIGCGSVGLSTIFAFASVVSWAFHSIHHPIFKELFIWIPAGDLPTKFFGLQALILSFSFQLDSLSAIMLLFVTFVGFWIHIYSIGYMWEDEGYNRFFSYLNLFMFSMLILVLADNFPLMFIGWEGVGLCSYLLIGFYYKEEWPQNAGKKAFITNRVGDWGFLIGMFFIFYIFGSLRYKEVFSKAISDPEKFASYATIICLFLFIGATGKSAQIPLYVWLPDAMAGPTPVSALIHAATMVTAGVYMVTRCNPLYRLSPTAMTLVAIIGGATALFAATMGIAQKDIKKILAYSTISQLGYMFLAAGVGAYIYAIFHVLTHAFFKACLFLGSGSVIHSCHTNDIMEMGGLKKYQKTTHWTFLLATLAISGFPFFSGFFSKDGILSNVFSFGHSNPLGYILYSFALLTAIITAFYMGRLYFITFWGEYRGKGHPHESPKTMTSALVVLGILSLIGGFIGLPGEKYNLFSKFLEPIIPLKEGLIEQPHHLPFNTEAILILLSIGAAFLGFFLAYKLYIKDKDWNFVKNFVLKFPNLYKIVFNKYYIDEFYGATVVLGTIKGAEKLAKFDLKGIDSFVNGVRHATVGTSLFSGFFDLKFVDGIVNFVANFLGWGGNLWRKMQTGVIQHYAFILTFGVFFLITIYLIFF